MNKKYIILGLIIIFSAFLRLWQLDIVPPGIHADEADTGYSAYSILKTGLDPHGELNLLALNDSNTGGTHPPIYTYLLMPLVSTFGLNIFIERLPSAIFGILSVLLVFFISKKLFNSLSLALVVSLLFTLNPWAIHISRQGLLEAQSLFFVLLGAMFFLYSDINKRLLIFSGLSFGLALFSYDAPKIFIPPFLFLITYFYWEKLVKFKKYLIACLLIFAIFYGAIINITFFRGDIADYNRSTIFTAIPETVNIERTQTKAPLWLSSIFHNKFSVSLKKLETSYSSIFSINWFFVNGSGNPQHAVGNHGEFFLFELPFFFIGMYLAFKKSFKLGIFLLGWMLIGALPGGLTSGNYVYRSVHILPIPIIFSSLGIMWFWKILSKSRDLIKYGVGVVFLIVSSIFALSYLFTYFYDFPVYASEAWAKQQVDAIKYVASNKNNYEKIFIDGGEPWVITYAYLYKVNPAYYQKQFKNQTLYRDKKIIQIDNLYFGFFNLEDIATPSAFFPKNSMVVTNANNFSRKKFITSFKDPGNVRDIFKVFTVE